MIKIKKVKKNRTANKSGFRKAATYVSKTIYFYAVVKDNVNLFGLLSICKPDPWLLSMSELDFRAEPQFQMVKNLRLEFPGITVLRSN